MLQTVESRSGGVVRSSEGGGIVVVPVSLQRFAAALAGGGRLDMTSRQIRLMFIVYTNSQPKEFRELAEMLSVQKPVITRALNTLSALGLLRRGRDENDKRRVFVLRTAEGQRWVEKLVHDSGPLI